MKEKLEEYKKLKKIPKGKLTPEQKERLKELAKELAKVILQWILNILTLGIPKLIKK